jgi:hypothetical protein
MIWINPEQNIVKPANTFDDLEVAQFAGFSQHFNPYESRLLSGEIPEDWNNPVLPDRKHFHELASGSQLWDHISTHTPTLSMLLYIALTTSTAFDNTTVMSDIKNMMKGVVAQLGTDHALHSTPSSVIINDPTDPEGLPIPDATMADHLDQMLSECWFGFSYADLMNP